jgi:hypothetical protein
MVIVLRKTDAESIGEREIFFAEKVQDPIMKGLGYGGGAGGVIVFLGERSLKTQSGHRTPHERVQTSRKRFKQIHDKTP